MSRAGLRMVLRRICLLQKPRVGYIGFVGYHNLGDEAVYSGVSRVFGQNRLDVYAAWGRRERLLQKVGLSGPGFFRSVVLGGGTLVNPTYLPAVQSAFQQGCSLYMFGTGVGSPGFSDASEVSLSGWAEALRAFSVRAVRGPLSQSTLRRIGVENVDVIGDPALALTAQHLPARRSVPRLSVNLVEPVLSHDGDPQACWRAVCRIAQEFLSEGGEVIPIVLGDGDEVPLRRLARELRLSPESIVDARDDLRLFFETVSGSEGLVGVRLHSAVLACCIGVPPLLFEYRPKCRDFMESMALTENLVPFSADGAAMLRRKWITVRDNPGLGARVLERAQYWRDVQTCLAERLMSEWKCQG